MKLELKRYFEYIICMIYIQCLETHQDNHENNMQPKAFKS